MDATPDQAPQDDGAVPAGGAVPPTGASPSQQSHEELRVTVRRSPKYGVFTAIGALVGIVAAWILTSSVGPSADATGQQVDTTPVIGLMLVVGFVVGGVLGAIVAIIVDRSLSRGTRTVLAERIETRDAEALEASPADVGEAAFAPLEPAADDGATPQRAAAPEDDRPREG
ncbi:hypothetical protein [Agrococcus sp. DT81.2]|uniref:hypothetical protein n=1 Tax=Agrococcus sp. DT81.2 TaxID=3393414 RepID=UPI003CE50FE3